MDEGAYYTLAVWRVTEGREDEFVRAWTEILSATFLSLDHPPVWGKLVRSVEDPRLFYSFGPWRSREDILAMRADPRGSGAIAQVAELCDQVTPGVFVEVASG
jgi:hypothetical protein